MNPNRRPSDKLSKNARFHNDQFELETDRAAIIKNDLRRSRVLSAAQKRTLDLAAPAFVAGEGAR